MNSIKLFLIFIILLTSQFSFGQRKCGTVEYNRHLIEKNPAYNIDAFESWMEKEKLENRKNIFLESTKEEVYTIPVVIHVVHNGENIGVGSNISEAQILSQIEVLNEDFRRLNQDTINTPALFQPFAADTQIEFKLALQDPNGQPTSGIIRVQGTKTSWSGPNSSDDQELKALSFWPPEDYMNIWITTLNNSYLGYSQYPISDLPGMVSPFDRETDGVVINYRVFGSSDKGSFPNLFVPYDKGRTTTHEVGHFLGLRHIWGDVTSCGGTDYVDDTPDAEDSYSTCDNIDNFTCGSEDMYQNYMDYTYDACMNIYTNDQSDRMRIVMENSPRRKSLLSSIALNPPSNLPNLVQVRSIVSPTDITYRDSFNPVVVIQNQGTNTIFQYDVYLELNGSPFDEKTINDSIAVGSSVVVNLSDMTNGLLVERGQHEIKVGVRNPNGLPEVDLSGLDISKYFLSDPTYDIIPSIEEFEDTENITWSVYNPDNQVGWAVNSFSIENQFNSAAYMELYNYPVIGAEDWLVSPVLDFTGVPEANITFLYSYAQRNEVEDILEVRASVDGGESFPFTLITVLGSQLSVRPENGPWIPQSIEDWKKTIIELDELIGYDSVRIAFVTINAQGNNLILDDLEFHVTGWSDVIYVAENEMAIHPNPSEGDRFFVTVRTGDRQSMKFIIIDMQGRVVYEKDQDNVLNQTFEFELPGQRSGVYIIKAVGESYSQISKVVLKK